MGCATLIPKASTDYTLLSQSDSPTAIVDAEDTIRRHLDALASACTSLEHGMAPLKHRDGRVVSLHKLQGTIPTSFQGEIYNTPIVIWLLETYPRSAPYVHFDPTKDMAIKQPHSYVDPSGVVSIPYLQNWVYPSSNLVDLISNLSASFGRHTSIHPQAQTSSLNPNR